MSKKKERKSNLSVLFNPISIMERLKYLRPEASVREPSAAAVHKRLLDSATFPPNRLGPLGLFPFFASSRHNAAAFLHSLVHIFFFISKRIHLLVLRRESFFFQFFFFRSTLHLNSLDLLVSFFFLLSFLSFCCTRKQRRRQRQQQQQLLLLPNRNAFENVLSKVCHCARCSYWFHRRSALSFCIRSRAD